MRSPLHRTVPVTSASTCRASAMLRGDSVDRRKRATELREITFSCVIRAGFIDRQYGRRGDRVRCRAGRGDGLGCRRRRGRRLERSLRRGSLDASLAEIVDPGQDDGDRESEDRQQHDQAGHPVRHSEQRRNGRGDLDGDPGSNHISSGDPEYVPALQFGEQ